MLGHADAAADRRLDGQETSCSDVTGREKLLLLLLFIIIYLNDFYPLFLLLFS